MAGRRAVAAGDVGGTITRTMPSTSRTRRRARGIGAVAARWHRAAESASARPAWPIVAGAPSMP